MGEIVSFQAIEDGLKTTEEASFDTMMDKFFDEATQELPEGERIVRNVLSKAVTRIVGYLFPEDILNRRIEDFDSMSDEEHKAIRDELIKTIDAKTGSHLADLLIFDD